MNQFEYKPHIGEVLRKKISLYFQDNIAAPLLQIFQTDLFIPVKWFLTTRIYSISFLRFTMFVTILDIFESSDIHRVSDNESKESTEAYYCLVSFINLFQNFTD